MSYFLNPFVMKHKEKVFPRSCPKCPKWPQEWSAVCETWSEVLTDMVWNVWSERTLFWNVLNLFMPTGHPNYLSAFLHIALSVQIKSRDCIVIVWYRTHCCIYMDCMIWIIMNQWSTSVYPCCVTDPLNGIELEHAKTVKYLCWMDDKDRPDRLRTLYASVN